MGRTLQEVIESLSAERRAALDARARVLIDAEWLVQEPQRTAGTARREDSAGKPCKIRHV